LVVEGELGDHVRGSFDGMALARADGTTILTGPVRDQAELQGLIQRAADLGLTLLEVTAFDARGEPVSKPSARRPQARRVE
jgi:hypothetical protein